MMMVGGETTPYFDIVGIKKPCPKSYDVNVECYTKKGKPDTQ